VTRALYCAIAFALPALSQPTLVFDATTQTVRAGGIARESLQQQSADELSRILTVFFERSTTPMLGDYEVDADTLRFQPHFPLLRGSYHALLDLSLLPNTEAPVRRLDFRVDVPDGKPTARVTGIYPSGSVVPANLLRIYIVFSKPMSRRAVESWILLLDERGTPVEHPFVDTRDGLWDPDCRRLTLILDPGRIKRGLVLHDTMGPPLKPRQRYRLVIPQDLNDADGMPLAEAFQKEYQVAADDRTSPAPEHWIIQIPRAGTRRALVVTAGKPLDEPLFERLVRPEDADGRPERGDALVDPGGTVWRFVPAEAWRAGQYSLRVEAELEDLAGNRPGRLFDEPADPSGQRKEAHPVTLRFRVR
jgi:hypothetical protein